MSQPYAAKRLYQPGVDRKSFFTSIAWSLISVLCGAMTIYFLPSIVPLEPVWLLPAVVTISMAGLLLVFLILPIVLKRRFRN